MLQKQLTKMTTETNQTDGCPDNNGDLEQSIEEKPDKSDTVCIKPPEDTACQDKLSHKKWRALIKKQKRKIKRQATAQVEEQVEENIEKEIVELSPRSLARERFEVQQVEMRQKYEENLRLAMHERWLEREKTANLLFLQKKKWEKLEKERKLEEEKRIREEWEERQKQEALEQEEHEERKKKQEELLKEATKNEKKTEDGPWKNPEAPVLVPGIERETCPFFKKVAACRFGDRCSRGHPYPESASTLVLPAMYSHFKLNLNSKDDFDTDIGLEYEDSETYQHFMDFYYDTLPEFQKFGRVIQFKVCANYEHHLRGNVYVEYDQESDALMAQMTFNGRWYAKKQIGCELASIDSWRNAICGVYFRNKCPKGKTCNFLHCFRNPGNAFWQRDKDLEFPHDNWSRAQWSERSSGKPRNRRSRSPKRGNRRHYRDSRSPSPYKSKSRRQNRYRSRSPVRKYSSRARSRSPDSRYSSRARSPGDRYSSRARSRSPDNRYSSRARSPYDRYSSRARSRSPNSRYSSKARSRSPIDKHARSRSKSPANKYSSKARSVSPSDKVSSRARSKSPLDKYSSRARSRSPSERSSRARSRSPSSRYSSSRARSRSPSSRYSSSRARSRSPSSRYSSSRARSRSPSSRYSSSRARSRSPSSRHSSSRARSPSSKYSGTRSSRVRSRSPGKTYRRSRSLTSSSSSSDRSNSRSPVRKNIKVKSPKVKSPEINDEIFSNPLLSIKFIDTASESCGSTTPDYENEDGNTGSKIQRKAPSKEKPIRERSRSPSPVNMSVERNKRRKEKKARPKDKRNNGDKNSKSKLSEWDVDSSGRKTNSVNPLSTFKNGTIAKDSLEELSQGLDFRIDQTVDPSSNGRTDNTEKNETDHTEDVHVGHPVVNLHITDAPEANRVRDIIGDFSTESVTDENIIDNIGNKDKALEFLDEVIAGIENK